MGSADKHGCERAVRNNIHDPNNIEQSVMAVVALARALDARLNQIEDRLRRIELTQNSHRL
jgi:hypothetical protein